jgi:Zn finger protein HypA/HybF involved in hydrogenase expression
MGALINLAEHRPHLSGKARCTACGHEWVAVAPVGTLWFDCPACHTERGLYVAPITDVDGSSHIFLCPCGGDAFAIHLFDGVAIVHCVRCGARSEPW